MSAIDVHADGVRSAVAMPGSVPKQSADVRVNGGGVARPGRQSQRHSTVPGGGGRVGSRVEDDRRKFVTFTAPDYEEVEDRIDQGVKVHDIARVLQFVLVLDDLRNKILQGLEEKR